MEISQSDLVRMLLLVLGLVLLWTAVADGGPETNTVRQYTATEITHEEGTLVLTDRQRSEERRGNQATGINIDDRIVCLPDVSWECSLFRQAYQGEINATGINSQFRFAYIDGEFYDLDRGDSSTLQFERTDAERVFELLAVDGGRLTAAERSVLDEGQITTTRPLPHENRIVEDGGEYYTILQTGTKRYGDGSSFCSSSGNGFCDRADRERFIERASQIGLGILGLLGTAVGGYGIVKRRL